MYLTTFSPARHHVIARGLRATMRLRVAHGNQAEGQVHWEIMVDPLVSDAQARDSLHELEELVTREGLDREERAAIIAARGCEECHAEPGEDCGPWCTACPWEQDEEH